MIPAAQVAKLQNALPFWLSLCLIPLIIFVANQGGWWLLLMPLSTWWLFTMLDAATGLNLENADLETREEDLFWYRLVTLIWFPLQFCVIFGMIWYVSVTDHLNVLEQILLFFGVGVISGTIGINYSHELMHQKSKAERWLGDLLLATVLYSHFRSEHLLVHHRYVGTNRDPVTARYNEGFHRFFPRVLIECWRSAFRAEKAMLARKGLPWTDLSNPFWRYWALQGGFLLLAFAIGGTAGVALFIYQAFIAIWQLELTNYVEHYGLTRKHLGDGKYEHVLPRHSWNAAHKASNWLLINLQRHSDHHYKPDRRFPLLQNYTEADAPQLPFGYPVMTAAAMIPPVYKRMMNPRVKKWRQMYYPEITDWHPYNKALHPAPR
ncbi:alkane 1-monooxygenase [Roseobacter sp. HKCCD9010]|uniref:alkane 1-monooxygenase n=1 Tax=Rhodobacterales TaxID=204455 RepID=UPI001492AF2C|nr:MULTISPECIES: alkane 1-monooxygenase [Rhodobacterales]MBF9048556.1 alkane 1-monooxygenase [Rhodobacterales bacterium HKCCD4356]NNV10555.1 alkane 1-monooxygenase [Roseobacter sp. HKCCD7357]NNV14740.1 alkane 1-monooxygenase [Roseobacter sp. HKCCD8768]NNV24199.1 alkane 1-monooxygenase [Roseobacter sp. HKCCD8192]NNV28456.1 alkane 1-monooxygenase [Roseobacter sp. HKCCD9061]